MQYLGGKAGVGKQIAQICEGFRQPGALFVDMFCGSLNVVRHAKNPRIAIDACWPLITMWRAALGGWVPPKVVTKEDYEKYKRIQDPEDPMTAFVLFGCSFGGKWCGGYAKDRPEQRYAECARNGIIKKAKDCQGLVLEHNQFNSKQPGCWPEGTVLYCDPPYEGTTGYKAIWPFDSSEFWDWAESHARLGVHVFVSEGLDCTPPKVWKAIGEQKAPQGGRLTPGTKKARVDRLFAWGAITP